MAGIVEAPPGSGQPEVVAGQAGATAGSGQPSEAATFHEDRLGGLRFFWQLPAGGVEPRAVLFMAHGAGHGAEDFFEEPGFGGLPEEHAIVRAALAHRMLPVAASSGDRRGKVWDLSKDGPRVREGLREVIRREGLSPEIPVFAFGASNGGIFVLMLAGYVRLRAIVCQIMAMPTDLFETLDEVPPMLFSHMPRDKTTARGVKIDIEFLHGIGNIAQELILDPLPIGPTFFADRCGIDRPTSEAMAEALRAAGLTGDDGHLLKDPRRSDWKSVLREPFASQLGDTLTPNRSPIYEVLNVAWGHHELTSEGIEETLEFCEKYSGLLKKR